MKSNRNQWMRMLLAGLSVGVILYLLWMVKSDSASEFHYEERLIDSKARNIGISTPEILMQRGWKRIDFSKWPSANITEAQSNEIVVALAGVLEAYTNANEIALTNAIARVPGRLFSVERFTYQRLMSPVWSEVNSFLNKLPYEKYDNTVEFTAHMKLGITMIRFVCDLEARRETGSVYAQKLEWKLLRQMQVKAEGFRCLGQNELANEMQKYIDKWILQIESECGYARRYAWLQVSAQYGHITDGSWTVWKLFRVARLQASGLVNQCNYRPNWIDKDFPIPEGMKDLWEEQ